MTQPKDPQLIRPAQFWLNIRSERIYFDCDSSCPDDEIHVIEFSAYQDLQSKLEKAEAENKRLREALEFYANEMNYSIDDYRGVSGEMIKRCVLYSDCEERNEFSSYAGRLARKALKGEGG